MSSSGAVSSENRWGLSEQQRMFFERFGFLRLRGRFADDIAEICAAFDEVFASVGPGVITENVKQFSEALLAGQRAENTSHLNQYRPRSSMAMFVDRHPRLAALKEDPRLTQVVASLMPAGFTATGTTGNIFTGDTTWHTDHYGSNAGLLHIRCFFYLDRLDGSNGALRVIPGTNYADSEFAKRCRVGLKDWEKVEETYGVGWKEIPSWTIENEPGDLLVGNFVNVHATVGGTDATGSRRQFELSFCESVDE
jgi:ectoine hydroxylase-related dioxygenase (phytanoyl-CoA dioxygenase family)